MIALSSVNSGPIYLCAVIAILALLVAWVAYTETRGDVWVVRLDDEDDDQ